jgi:hypothetical protein
MDVKGIGQPLANGAALAQLRVGWQFCRYLGHGLRANSTDVALMAPILPNLGIFKTLQAAFPGYIWIYSVSVRMKPLPVEFDQDSSESCV